MNRRLIHAAAVVLIVFFALGARCPRDAERAEDTPAPLDVEAEDTSSRNRERAGLVERVAARNDIQSRRVMDAMRSVPRHMFIPLTFRPDAYIDTPLPIGHGQTISAPSVVALMTDLLEPDPGDVVLEVGTGSGYQAAVLAEIVSHVYTIEIIPELAETAGLRIEELGYENVTVKAGDGYRGWPEHAPFDGIIVTCAPTKVPEPLVEQLAPDGKMVIPVGEQWRGQQLYVMSKEDGRLVRQAVAAVQFVPMTGEAQEQAN